MKNRKCLILCVMGLFTCVFAKGQSGIYLNATDFNAHKLTYQSACDKNKHSIRSYDLLWNSPHVTAVSEGRKLRLKKGDLYGFRNCSNEDYRFYENSQYLIVEAGGIFIYSQAEHISQSKGFKIKVNYYFSAVADGTIYSLTPGNLRDVYRSNEQFTDLLDQYFNGADVQEYDHIHKTFKVNYVYNKIIKQKNSAH